MPVRRQEDLGEEGIVDGLHRLAVDVYEVRMLADDEERHILLLCIQRAARIEEGNQQCGVSTE